MSDIVNIGMFFVLIAVTNLFFAMTSSNLDDIESCEVGEFLLSKNQHTTDRKLKLTDPNTNTFLIGKTMTLTTDTQWRHKPKMSEKLGQCGRQNILRLYLKIWEWEWIFGQAVKTISSLGVHNWVVDTFGQGVSNEIYPKATLV